MKIEIDQDYIDWVRSVSDPDITDEQITHYVNEVLDNHRKSWEDADE